MALDGMVIADMANELNRDLTGGRIAKIAQPEKDELLLTIKQSIPQEGEKTLRSQASCTFGQSESSVDL